MKEVGEENVPGFKCMYVVSVKIHPSCPITYPTRFPKLKKQIQVVLLLPYRLTVSIKRVFSIIKTKLNTSLGW